MTDEVEVAEAPKTKRKSKAEQAAGSALAEASPPAGGGATASEEPSAVIEAAPGEVEAAIGSLGDAVARENSKVDLSEEGHETAIERMERGATEFPIDESSLVPDVRDFLLDQLKRLPKPWGVTPFGQQQDIAAACEHAGVELVRKVVEAIRASGAAEPIRCLLVGFTDKGDDIKVEAKVKALSTEETANAVLALHRARGKHVLLTVASVDEFRGEGRDAELLPDQPPLDFEAGSDEVALDEGEDEERESIAATGDVIQIEGEDYEIEIDLKTSMVVATPTAEGRALERIDVREATPAELAAERERIADFEEGAQ